MGLFSKKEVKEFMMPYDVIGPQSELDKKFGGFCLVAYGEVNGETLYVTQFFKLPAIIKNEYESIINKIMSFKAKEIKVLIEFKNGKPTAGGITVPTLLELYKDTLDLNINLKESWSYGDYRDYISYTEQLGCKLKNEYPKAEDLNIF